MIYYYAELQTGNCFASIPHVLKRTLAVRFSQFPVFASGLA